MAIYRPKKLHQAGIKPKRSLSQNFLVDGNIIRKALKAANIEQGDLVLEIGPGPGAITEELIKAGAKVTAIEKDISLAEHLKNHLDLAVICQDALTYPVDAIPPQTKIVANLPYHITTPLIEKFLTLSNTVTSMTLFVQHEVGKRICASVNTSEYSSFSLFVRCFSTPKYCFLVPSSCFFPSPKVDSCVIHLKLHPFPYSVNQELFFQMTRTAFGKRRKMLRGSLRDFADPKKIEGALKTLGHSPQARPGELSPDAFASLFELLIENPSEPND